MIKKMAGCTGCGSCKNQCPVECISMKEDTMGFLYPIVDEKRCIHCDRCEKECPILNQEKMFQKDEAFYGYHLDEEVRKNSSSGGAFTALAIWCLFKNGVVYGAVYDPKGKRAVYKSTDEVPLEALRKSKYVQSEMGNIYQDIDRQLTKKRPVLFTGTPCHAAGVRRYFRNHPQKELLLVCDFICHGVPSKKILKDHLTFLEEKYHSKCSKVDFRPKSDPKNPWYKHHLRVVFEDGSIYDAPFEEDTYMVGFLKQSLFLRESCYQCAYCEGEHQSDITLGDFWGVTAYDPSLNDEKGLSLIITHTLKGMEALKCCEGLMSVTSLPWCFASYAYKKRDPQKYNLARRKEAIKAYQEEGYIRTMEYYQQKDKKETRKKRKKDKLRRIYLLVKRGLDIFFAALLLLILWPLLLFIALFIKLDSKGPVFFKQKRMTKGRGYFQIYKFRSMKIDTPKDSPTHLLKNAQSYITPIGHFLRKSSLDELPQLFNILKGEMSFIGPRPALWNQKDLIDQRQAYGVNNLLPGLTGWAQVNGRDELSIAEKASYDREYAEKVSFSMDLKILFLTVYNVLTSKGIQEGTTLKQ